MDDTPAEQQDVAQPDSQSKMSGAIMKKDQIYLKSEKRSRDFEFDAEVAEVFDDMLERSIPFYLEQQSMIRAISKSLWVPGTRLYDLGC